MENSNIENKVVYLRLDDIIPNRFQPREIFDETGLEELADSIKEHGVIQPIIVRPVGDKYELVAGERRSKASAMAGLTTIPAIVRNMDDKESAKVSLLENLQRKNLSAIEEARTYKRILELDNMTQDELAKTMGKSQPLIANKLRLLALPEEIQDALIKNQISERHARSLLNVKDKKQQLQLLDRVRNERLTVRELDSEIKKLVDTNDTNNSDNSGGVTYNNFDETENIQNQNIPPIQSTNINSNYHGNFNSMGLNDYQSSVNNNMFNNLPNYSNFNNQFNNIPDNPSNNLMNANSQDNNFNYSNFDVNNNTFLSQPTSPNLDNTNYLNQPNNQENNYSSLGLMFDGGNTNMSFNNSNMDTSENDNKNLFISHIQEDEVKKTGNQFLPNFDDIPNNSGAFNQGKFNNTPDNFQNGYDSMNNFNNSLALDNSSNNSYDTFADFSRNDSLGMDNNYAMNNNNYNNVSNMENKYDTPINDFSSNSSGGANYQNNQGSLFNQPLNLVDVPNNNDTYTDNNNQYNNATNNFEYTNSEMNSQVDNDTQSNQPFDNPLDDPYENILFAKPVPIQKEEIESSESKPLGEEVEVIGEYAQKDNLEDTNSKDSSLETKTTKENEYITLDPIQTIFDTRGAVLELKKTTDRIKQNKINIDTEEIDFDNYYQITIRIKKE